MENEYTKELLKSAQAAPKEEHNDKKKNLVSGKLFLIGVVILLLIAALGLANWQLHSRKSTYNVAVSKIQDGAGNYFFVRGPTAYIPYTHMFYTEEIDKNGKKIRKLNKEELSLKVKADSVKIISSIKTEKRSVGIYSAPVYTGILTLNAVFYIDEFNDEMRKYHYDDAEVFINVDKDNLRSHPTFSVDDTSVDERSVISVKDDDSESGIKAVASLHPGRREVTIHIDFRGAASFFAVPYSSSASMEVECDWPAPGFTGYEYLPDAREISSSGFNASWSMPYADGDAKIGFDLVEPVDLYKRLNRAVKYGFLFIIVPFIVMFLFELFANVYLHPMHYLLCGAASVIFFLMLLAFSEHLSFMAAYLVSAGASAALTSLYLAGVTEKRKIGLSMCLLFLFLYVFLYFSLLSEDYAFLIGTIFTFVVLACIMYFTRHVDWSTLERKGKKNSN